MKFVEDKDAIRLWLATVHHFEFENPNDVMAIERDGKIIAAVIFTRWVGPDIHMHFAGSNLTRRFIRAMWNYAFVQMRCERVTVTIRADNDRSLGLIWRVGFQYEGRLRRKEEHNDLLIFGLLRDEAPVWMRT